MQLYERGVRFLEIKKATCSECGGSLFNDDLFFYVVNFRL